MKEPRNPFRLRASERIVSDTTFLRLYGPGMLDVLPKDQLWDTVHLLRSSRGGGKTSLMRLFTPNSLVALYANRNGEDFKELYQRMRGLGVVGEDGPRLLGVRISCDQNYPQLADMDLDQGHKERLFFGLLNARVVLALLQSVLALRQLEFPDDLAQLSVQPPLHQAASFGIDFPCNGQQLYDWANRLEAAVCDELNSFSPARSGTLPGQGGLSCLWLMVPTSITLDGNAVSDSSVLLLDDVHKLTRLQRDRLLQTVIGMRAAIGIWLAERFEALNTDEMLSSGAAEGRDYGTTILPEGFWRHTGNNRGNRFETLVLNIADRRARSVAEDDVPSFRSCFQDSLEGTEWNTRYKHIRTLIEARVRESVDVLPQFRDWVEHYATLPGSSAELAVAWRTLEILIEREKRRQQMRFDWALTVDELATKDDSAIREAAKLFLAHEFSPPSHKWKLPYYFGTSKLVSAASWNVEQFLGIAADQFEEAISEALLKPRQSATIAPARQEAILKAVGYARWRDIPIRVADGREVRNLLDCIGRFAQRETYRPTAPYAPGVTGIAISMKDRDILRRVVNTGGRADLVKLAQIIASALQHNLLEARLDQRSKDDHWMVLYLNRLLCVHFDLPLHYGGWREKSLSELSLWLEQGYKSSADGGLL